MSKKKFRKKMVVWITVLIILIFVAFTIGPMMSQVETPSYQVIKQDNKIEIRNYPALMVAQVSVSGDRKSAIQEGFKILADYIFGNNQPNEKIAMTKPVMQSQPNQIAMTAPVLQQRSDSGNQWLIRFVMPSQYTMENLPKPRDDRINIVSIPERQQAVIRFSGSPDDESLDKHLQRLNQYIESHQLPVEGQAMFAFYNPPWTFPLLRRNEIWYELKN